ncbi:MAG: transglutaminase-like domain-containing protein [Sulfurovaceae bacterium]|nr:transglutaminase-like domain-containing protein [Sulfurovaceae bacterium]MDD5548100.1 transglutaminase-like domain-containing protein [Sulfurovaceae bacterium]
MHEKSIHYFSLFMMVVAFVSFVYIVAKASNEVLHHHVGTKNGTYVNTVKITPEITSKALELTSGCKDDYCKAQRILDFVTAIPYSVNNYSTNTPKVTIKNNRGDCDDKSNLLISLLHEVDIKSYFVLVPEHIFVISKIKDSHFDDTKGFWISGAKYMILESTAKGSLVGFPLEYRMDEIEAIIDPFENREINEENLTYKQ